MELETFKQSASEFLIRIYCGSSSSTSASEAAAVVVISFVLLLVIGWLCNLALDFFVVTHIIIILISTYLFLSQHPPQKSVLSKCINIYILSVIDRNYDYYS